MATTAQTIANQANAQLSTGPRSPEGKTRSSANSRKDGLPAATLWIPEDQQSAFDEFRRELHRDTKPEGALEIEFFQRLLTYGWNLRRARSMEAQALQQTDPMQDDAAERKLLRIARYRRELERSHDRALGELRLLQTQRAVLLQQENVVIEAVYRPTPLAEVARLTRKTDPFFHDQPHGERTFYFSRPEARRVRLAEFRDAQNEANPEFTADSQQAAA